MGYKLRPYQERIVEKTRKAFKEGYKSPIIVSPAGSGKTVIIGNIIKSATDKKNHVLFIVHRMELIHQVRETLMKSDVNMDYVDLQMVITVANNLDHITQPTMIITDESHHGLANSYRKVYDYFPKALKVGFTATPTRLSGEGMGDVNDILIEEVDVQFLIDNNFLAPFRYYAPRLIDTEELELSGISDFSKDSIDDSMEINRIYGDVVRHYEKLAFGEQAIAYCHSVEASIATAEAFKNLGYKAVHVDGDTPKEERNITIDRFKQGDIRIITNVDIIGEGFDVPDCSTIIMLRPTQSLSLFIQQSMRGMRFRPHKNAVIIDHVDNVSRHGLPNDERNWTLESRTKKESKEEMMIKTCDKCYAVYHKEEPKCPICGHINKGRAREGYEVVGDADLEEVTESPFKLDFSHTIGAKQPKDCKTYKELDAIRKERGYKAGWTYYKAKQMGIKK